MTRDEIGLQQSDDMDLEVSDQELEAACGGLMQGSPLLFDLTASPVALICIEDSS